MSLFENISFINEGEQAEEYLQKKQNSINSKRSEDKKRYGSLDYEYAGDRSKAIGTRSKSNLNKGEHIERNPRFDSARKIKEYRDKYPDAVPERLSKNEKDLVNAEEKNKKASEYAKKVADSRAEIDYHEKSPQWHKVYDSAYRKYTSTHRHESGIFESVSFINE